MNQFRRDFRNGAF